MNLLDIQVSQELMKERLEFADKVRFHKPTNQQKSLKVLLSFFKKLSLKKINPAH